MEIRIDNLSYGGAGVGRIDGKVIFVEGGVPGDILKIKIVKERESYSRAVITEILERSDKRVEPECEFFSNCGGCCWQDVDYETQLAEKQKIVTDALSRIGKLRNIKVEDIYGSPIAYGYRNNLVLKVFVDKGEYKIGFFEESSHRNVAIDRCVIASDEINRVIKKLQEYLDEYRGPEIPIDRIYLSSTKGRVAIAFQQSDKGHRSEIEELIQNIIDHLESSLDSINLSHELEFEFEGCRYISNAYVFSQANYYINSKIVKTVSDWINPYGKKTLLDLYCGTGNFSITLSKNFDRVVGVDSDRDSIRLAKRNADLNGVKNIKFINDKCKNYLKSLEETPDAVLADPPRAGMKDLIGYLEKLKPGLIIYISCNPATLARDLNTLVEKNYRLKRIKPFDMFPHTYHVEVASLLELI